MDVIHAVMYADCQIDGIDKCQEAQVSVMMETPEFLFKGGHSRSIIQSIIQFLDFFGHRNFNLIDF